MRSAKITVFNRNVDRKALFPDSGRWERALTSEEKAYKRYQREQYVVGEWLLSVMALPCAARGRRQRALIPSPPPSSLLRSLPPPLLPSRRGISLYLVYIDKDRRLFVMLGVLSDMTSVFMSLNSEIHIFMK